MKYRFPFRKLFENKYCTQNIALIKLNVYKNSILPSLIALKIMDEVNSG